MDIHWTLGSTHLGVSREIISLGPEDDLLLDARVEDLVRVTLGELDGQRHLLSGDEGLDCLVVLQIPREGNGLTSLTWSCISMLTCSVKIYYLI